MSRDPFYTGDAVRAFQLEALSWLGTPFRWRCVAKGGGVDCVGLVVVIYQQTGLLGEVTMPKYSLNGGAVLTESPVDRVVQELGRFEVVWHWPEAIKMLMLQVGDLLTMRFGRVPYHCGLAISDQEFIHAHPKAGVVRGSLADWSVASRFAHVYRPIKT